MWTIPGTVLHANRKDAESIPQQLKALFFGGGITLSQVTAVTGLEAHTVQNWVKRGFLSSPVGKRYTLRQLCRILNINMLRGAMPIERICRLLSYVNGQLDDERDDMIDDAQLYFLFVKLAAQLKELYEPAEAEQQLVDCLADYEEPVPGARERVRQTLKIMLTAYLAARMMQETEKMLNELSWPSAKKSLSKHLGRGVKIVVGKRKGRFELDFYGQDDLQVLLDALMKIQR